MTYVSLDRRFGSRRPILRFSTRNETTGPGAPADVGAQSRRSELGMGDGTSRRGVVAVTLTRRDMRDNG